MKISKSSLSLRSLAMSIKQSIQLDSQKTKKKQPTPIKLSKLCSNSMPKERTSDHNKNGRQLSKQQKMNRVFVLEKQIYDLEKQVKQCSISDQDYTKQLQTYQNISKIHFQCQADINAQKRSNDQIRNQILMLKEEIRSVYFNIENKIAQKQYHEELIDTYKHQYENQSKLSIKSHHILLCNENLNRQKRDIQQLIEKYEQDFQQWKAAVQYHLNEHKLKNSIKIIRTKLISLENKFDDASQHYNLKKIREHYCLFFKQYSIIHEISNDEAEKGIDIFICTRELAKQFGKYLKQKLTQNSSQHLTMIEEYIENLSKMEEIFKKSLYISNKKIYSQFVQNLNKFQILKRQKIQEIDENNNRIKSLNEQIDDLFNNESIAIIEYMRQKNENIYDLKEIKQTLRESKKEQKNRIKKVIQSYRRIKSLEYTIQTVNIDTVIKHCTNQIQMLSQDLFASELKLQQLENKCFKLIKNKSAVEDKIDEIVTKWRKIDQTKQKIKKLYRQLQAVKNTQDQSEIKEQVLIKNAQYSQLLKHSKNTSMSFLQYKPILSLSNPYKKMIEKSAQIFQPILSSCQLVLSKKQTKKDHTYKCYQPKSNKLKHQSKNNLLKTQERKQKSRQSNKQNTKLSFTKSKKSLTFTKPKGKESIAKRQSLSTLLISRFNR